MLPNILILRFPYTSALGGTEKQTLSLLAKLRERGVNFFLLSSCSILLAEFQKRNWPARKIWGSREPVTPGRVLLFLFLAPLLLFSLWPWLVYYRLRKKTKILYCLSLTEKLVLTIPARLLGYKVFWVEHVIPGRWLRLNPWRLLYLFNSFWVRIIAVSEAVKKTLVGLGVSEKRIRVIYNGIELAAPENYRENKRKFISLDQSERRAFTVGIISRLNREKGVEYLLGAIKIAQEFIPELELIVIGDGPEKKNLIWLAKELQLNHQVKFVGYQEKVIDWIDSFDVLVLPTTKKEAFGLVLLEAMARGKPIIATKVGGIPEVILDQKTGLLVKPQSGEEIANALIYLFNHPETRDFLGQNGRERVSKHFTLDRMTEDYYQFLKS